MMNNTRKGYATVEDITKISIARASAINGGGGITWRRRGENFTWRLGGGGGRSWYI
ncbi:unnamed protein product [Brassica oleracea]